MTNRAGTPILSRDHQKGAFQQVKPVNPIQAAAHIHFYVSRQHPAIETRTCSKTRQVPDRVSVEFAGIAGLDTSGEPDEGRKFASV